MTVEDALIDTTLPLTERAKTLIADAVRVHDTYHSTTGYLVEMGQHAVPYIISEGDAPETHLAEIENKLRLKDAYRASMRNADASRRGWR